MAEDFAVTIQKGVNLGLTIGVGAFALDALDDLRPRRKIKKKSRTRKIAEMF